MFTGKLNILTWESMRTEFFVTSKLLSFFSFKGSFEENDGAKNVIYF